MKKYILFLCCHLVILSLSAQAVYKKGQIKNSEEWSGMVKVEGDVEIAGNGKLTIKPGTYIEFLKGCKITVKEDGCIQALGGVNDTIYFTSADKVNGWGGIRFNEMSNTADSSKFSFCSFSYSITDEYNTGGAITINYFNKIKVQDSRFFKNTAEPINYGGAIYCESSDIDIIRCEFRDNYSSFGGALSFKNSSPSIKNSTFINNGSYHGASAIYYMSCDVQLSDCLFFHNYTNTTGGEILYVERSTGKIINTEIRNNKNKGIYCYLSDIEIVNVLIANNSAPDVGGIQVQTCRPTIINSTIVNNFGQTTGGIRNSHSEAKIINSIIWGNKGAYNNLSIEGDYFPTIKNSNIRIDDRVLIPSDLYFNNMEESPRFANLCTTVGTTDRFLDADWSLSPFSPCIDKGDNTLLPTNVETDLNHAPRIYNQTVDLGAYELQKSSLPDLGKKVLFVSSAGTGKGESWEDAMGNLQDAINYPIGSYKEVEVWVKEGTYLPDTTGLEEPRSASFRLKNQVAIYGGFKGNETSLNQRDFEKYETILSGNIGDVDDIKDNVFSVISATRLDFTSQLDGITVEGGRTIGAGFASKFQNGGGINLDFADITIRNCKIIKNIASSNGGGLYAYYSNPIISNTLIADNESRSHGGGIYLFHSHASFESCRIINNKLPYHFDGGGMYLGASNPRIVNTIIANNQSGQTGDGGGIYSSSSEPYILNSAIVNNYSHREGSGIFVSGGANLKIVNSVVWGNENEKGFGQVFLKEAIVSIESSIVQGGNTFRAPNYHNNIEESPRFIMPALNAGYDSEALSANWGVLSCSPAINSGNNTVSYCPEFDIVGNKRNVDNIDIGPYEFIGTPTEVIQSKNIIYVDSRLKGDGSSWSDAMSNLQNAIDKPCGCYQSNEIWVAKGTYLPDTVGLPDKRSAAITLRNNTKIYGGFAGVETKRDERDWRKNPTILSGDIGKEGNFFDNSYHVVVSQNMGKESVLDGFIIRDGNSDGYFENGAGGGIYCVNSTNSLTNLEIKYNYANQYGGALYIKDSQMELMNLFVSDNVSGSFGGGIRYDNSNIILHSCEFKNNKSDYSGGAISSSDSKSVIVNCLIANNSSDRDGVIGSFDSDTRIINSTIVNNQAGGFVASKNFSVENSVIWGNGYDGNPNQGEFTNIDKATILNSNIQGGNLFNLSSTNYLNNLDTLPGFIRPIEDKGVTANSANADWHVNGCSPCIDKGGNSLISDYAKKDFDGNPRIYNGRVDMGAFEVQHVKRNAPSDILLSDTIIYKYAEPLSLIGRLSAVDKDEEDSFKYQLAGNNYIDSHEDFFTIKNDSLLNKFDLSNSFDTHYSIEIKVTDKYSCWLTKNFKIKVDTTDIDNSKGSLKNTVDYLVYPNPAGKWVFVKDKSGAKSLLNIEIYSMEGELIKKVSTLDIKYGLNLEFLEKGVYLMVISDFEGKNKIVKKFAKE